MPARRPTGSAPLPIHSIRVPDSIWLPAKEIAKGQEETMTAAINRFLLAYSRGEKEALKIGGGGVR